MTTSAVDVFSYVAGVISLVALAYTASRGYLPSARMKELQEVLEDTENILRGAVEAGYLTDPRFISKVQYKLNGLKRKSDQLRARSLCATSPFKEWKELFAGLSRSIGGCIRHAKCLRATVVTTSEAARRRLDNEGGSDPMLQLDDAFEEGEDGIPEYDERAERARANRSCRVPVRSASCPPSLHNNFTNPVTHMCGPLGEGQSQVQAAERDSGRPEALHYGTDSDDVSIATLFEPPPILSDEEPDSVPGLTMNIGSTACEV